MGQHDRLSLLLQVFQSARSNLRSSEAPSSFEDHIPGWELSDFNEEGAPPYLKLVPRNPEVEDYAAVYIYEVNYSSLAGVVRQNHTLDLTQLFVGFDMAVAISRQRLRSPAPTLNVGDAKRLGSVLQRVSGVFAAATGPLLGLPSMLLRKYTNTVVAVYTRFFEDVATFALDRNGEKVISAHFDRTVENIVGSPQFTGQGVIPDADFIVAAHSLGSVVVHNHLVRKWTDVTHQHCVPRRLVTFGSPIGLLTWLWLFLDFPDLTFTTTKPRADAEDRFDDFFCWTPANNAGQSAAPLTWINVANRLDPIATVFPAAAVDMSRPVSEVIGSLAKGEISHRFHGNSKITSVGAAHTQYLNDRDGFLEILLRLAGLSSSGEADEVQCATQAEHWRSTRSTLRTLLLILWIASFACAVAYCGLITWTFRNLWVLGSVIFFVVPPVTIGLLAFWQRLFFGGPTKRVPTARIRHLKWLDLASFPYRLRGAMARAVGAPEKIDPNRPARTRPAIYTLKALAFVPTLLAMMIPVCAGYLITHRAPAPPTSVTYYVGALLIFVLYQILCAAYELVASWLAVLNELKLGD